jgi:hypothetical protein
MSAHSKFAHSIQWYAQHYGISLSLAKRLSAAGVNFDDPEVMRAHVEAASKGSESERNSPLNPLVSTEALETPAGMSPGIQRLQADEVRLYVIYQKAQASGNMAKAKACREAWLTVFEQLRRVERINPEVERLKRESVSIAEIEFKLSKLHGKIRTMLDALPDRLTHRLVGLEADAIRRELCQEVNDICGQLVTWVEVQRNG